MSFDEMLDLVSKRYKLEKKGGQLSPILLLL
jgi:hypothetical protein